MTTLGIAKYLVQSLTASIYADVIAKMLERDPEHLHRRYWEELSTYYLKYGYTPTPEQYVEDYRRAKTVRVEAARESPWAGREYPVEYIEGYLRGLDRVLVKDQADPKANGEYVASQWGFIRNGRFVPGRSLIWVRNELDCYRQYSSSRGYF